MKLRALALILTVVLCLGIMFTGNIVSAEKMRGDINSDGVVNTKDLLLLRKSMANLIDLSDEERVQADCNNDNELDIKDINAMISYLLKKGKLYTEYENAWKTLYDWDVYGDEEKPSEFTIPATCANGAVVSTADLDNKKNPLSQKAVALLADGVYYENNPNPKGSNPTVKSTPISIKIAKSNTSTEIAGAKNLRALMKYQPKFDELSVVYIGYSLKGSLDKYYHRITLENYSKFNYFYFADKEYTKVPYGYERRTYLPDETVETVTLQNDDVEKIKNIYIWFESDKGTAGSPIYIDDVDYYLGDPTFDGSVADDAALPQPKEPENDGIKKYMAISFDDSPQTYGPTGKHYIDYYLDLAKEYNAKFTFFIIGNNCDTGDINTLKRAVAEGHSLENHSWTHPYLENKTLDEATKQLSDVDDWLQSNVDKNIKTKYLRPPFLNVGATVYKAAENVGIKACIAGPCSADYNRPSVDYSELYYEKNLGDGVISLNHENYIEGVETVRRILEHFSKLGYEFVTVDELFNIKGVTPTLNKVYYKVG